MFGPFWGSPDKKRASDPPLFSVRFPPKGRSLAPNQADSTTKQGESPAVLFSVLPYCTWIVLDFLQSYNIYKFSPTTRGGVLDFLQSYNIYKFSPTTRGGGY